MVCSILTSLSLTISWSLSQIHVHCISDAIQPSQALMPSSSALNLSQRQGLFQWVSCSHQIYQMTKILELQLQHAEGMLKEWRNIHSFQWIFRVDFDWLIGSLCCPRDSQESSPALQFKGSNSLALSFIHSPTLTSIHDYWKNHSLTRWTFVDKVMSLLFNMLSRLVIAFLPRSKHLLISWL